MLTRLALTYFLVTPLGKNKNKTSSATMAGKVDPANVIDVNYDDIPEADYLAFEEKLKLQQEEAKKNLLSCYRKTRNEVIKKAEFAIPPLEFASSSANVSFIAKDAFDLFLMEVGKKLESSRRVTQNILFDLSERMDKIDKGKSVDTSYFAKDLTLELFRWADTTSRHSSATQGRIGGHTSRSNRCFGGRGGQTGCRIKGID